MKVAHYLISFVESGAVSKLEQLTQRGVTLDTPSASGSATKVTHNLQSCLMGMATSKLELLTQRGVTLDILLQMGRQ
jgi:hypothetical protein